MGKNPSTIKSGFRLSGRGGPTYLQKIKIIDQTEKKFSIRIPDEQWRVMTTAGDLVNFVEQKRQHQ